MGFFDYGRKEGFPSQYAEYKTPVTADVLEAGLISAFVILAVTYLIIIPGYSKKKSIYVSAKVFFSLFIGCSLMVGNFGQEWEVGGIQTKTPYRAGISNDINATIGVKFGLRSINITLTGKFINVIEGRINNEIIDYNERFAWTWDQGRIGFGIYAGRLQQNFREAQRRGLPNPILSIVDYLVIDGEGLRWGRHYRTAGWYTHILMWSAFPAWILANVFLQSVGRYAAYFTALTGGLQIASCIVWASVRNPLPLVISFDSGTLTTRFGSSFWLTLSCGHLCLLLASIIIIMDLRFPDQLSEFLGIDPLDDYDECVLNSDDLRLLQGNMKNDGMEMQCTRPVSGEPYEPVRVMTLLRRRTTVRKAQKALFRTPVSLHLSGYQIYENGCRFRKQEDSHASCDESISEEKSAYEEIQYKSNDKLV